jgi:NAD+-dependent protein deacetylase sirtuin 4
MSSKEVRTPLDRVKKLSYLGKMESRSVDIALTAHLLSGNITETAVEMVKRAADILSGRPAIVLSGAGISTDSGIPDYRGPGTIKKNRNPVFHTEFVNEEQARRRYWSRSYLGWPRVRDALPNRCHSIVAELEAESVITGVITQNVDGLHQAAGSPSVLELHGALKRVVCLSCGRTEARESVQKRLAADNLGFPVPLSERGSPVGGTLPRHGGDARNEKIAPDGDIELPASATEGFRTPRCLLCGGVLKPDVVFFGDAVPTERLVKAQAMVTEAEALLVLGSSLTVFSGFRFVRQTCSENKPIVILTLGPTRGDELAEAKIDAPLRPSLELLLRCLDRKGL